MSKLNYRQIETALKNRVPFKGNSCRAELEPEGTYVVYSYQTTIAHVINDKHTLNARKYSVTTSRLQNIIRRAWADKNLSEVGN